MFIFKTIIAVLKHFNKQLINADFEIVNSLLSEMNKNETRVVAEYVKEVIATARSIDVTLPDVTSIGNSH